MKTVAFFLVGFTLGALASIAVASGLYFLGLEGAATIAFSVVPFVAIGSGVTAAKEMRKKQKID